MSRPRLVWLAALVLVVCAGCASTGAVPTEQSLAERVVHEAYELKQLITGRRVLFFPLVLLLGWAISRALGLGTRVLWQLGIDPEHRLGGYAALYNFVIAVLVAWAIAARMVAVAPVLALAGLGLALAAITVALREQVQDVAVGFSLVARRRLREGDRVHVGEHAGTVRRVGLTRVELRGADGAVVWVPTRLLGQGALVIGHAKHTVPVAVTVQAAPERAADAVELARRTALFSPFRAVGSGVEVRDAGDGSLRVEIQAWSDAAVRDAKSQLELALSRELGRR